MSPRANLFICILASLRGQFVPAAGQISAGGEAALTKARLAGDCAKLSVSVSIVRPPIGSTSAAFGVSCVLARLFWCYRKSCCFWSLLLPEQGLPLSVAVLVTLP